MIASRLWLGASALVLASFAPRLALAQDTRVDALIVTAAKRPTKLLDTPMSLTVVDHETLEATHATDFADFAKLVPGLSYTDAGPGNKRYALRGLQSAGEPEVAVYYDEIPVAGAPGGSLDTGDSQPDLKLVDIERVEVLRGPQGTLYGNGSMGGAIRFLSKRPDLARFSAAGTVAASTTNGGGPSGRGDLTVNLPLVRDKVALRLVGYVDDEGGWIDNHPSSAIALPQIDQSQINWEHTRGGRASLAVAPTANWTLTAIAYHQVMKVGDAFEIYPAYSGADPYIAKAYIRRPWTDTVTLANLISDQDLGAANLVVTASYQERTLARIGDTTRFLLRQFGCTELTWGHGCVMPPYVPAVSYSGEYVRSWSGEARLASTGEGRFHWTIGAFFQSTDTRRKLQVAPADASGYIQFDAAGVAKKRLFARDNADSFDQYAVFGEGSYDITDRLTATLGARWFRSERTDQQVILQQFFPGAPTGAQPFQEFSQDKVFKKVELAYRTEGRGLVYAQAAQGFRAGGPNFPGGFALSAPPYAADSVWNYEAGWKGQLADGRLYLTAAAFDIEWSDLQQLLPQALFSYIVNGGKARSQGAELEMRYAPRADLTLTLGATYNDARLVGAQPTSTDPASQTHAGDKLAGVPDWTANAAIEHKADLGGGLRLTSRLDVAYQSSRSAIVATQNPAYFTVKSYTLADAHFAMDDGGPWTAFLDVTNLFDQFAQLSGRLEDSNLVRTLTPARPRTLTLGVSARF